MKAAIKLKIFLRTWAVLCITVMAINWTAFIFEIQAFNPGGEFNWLIWDGLLSARSCIRYHSMILVHRPYVVCCSKFRWQAS